MQLRLDLFQFWKFYLPGLKIHADIPIRKICRIRLTAVMFAFEFGIPCMFFEKLLISGIHVVYSICKGKFIHFS